MKSRQSPRTYLLAEVMGLTGAKRPQIEYWVRKGLIRGEFEQGTGLPRQFVFRNLVEIAIAVELTELGVSTEAISSILDKLRYGDVETDVRTPWFVEMTRRPAIEPPKMSRKDLREARAALKASMDATPLEERCCAELNDDGTLKLLKLLRAYIDAGVRVAQARKALMAVAKEHIQDHERWARENEAFHRRWRQFKNPRTRPQSAPFWLLARRWSSEDGKSRWLHSTLTDFHDKDDSLRDGAVIAVSLRPVLERLERATNDSWPATPEKRVFRSPEPAVSARRLVNQAFHEYERTEEINARRALQQAQEPIKERVHAAK
jgi:DNA-binding transcriptional MerR regulator